MQLKAQTRTHPSGSQSGRSAAIPLRSRSRGTRSHAPRSTSARWARARSRSHACAPLQPSARASSQASARQLPRPGLRAAPLPRAGSPAHALRPVRARAVAREGGAEVDLGLDFSGEWNREQRGNKRARGTTREETQRKGKGVYLQPVGSISVIF